jgi:putative sigma-54 modulation protein
MNVHFTARHLILPPELKAYAQKRLSALEPVMDSAAEVDVILSAEKNRLRAEILVRGRRASVRVAEDGRDLAVVMNEAFDVLEKKYRKEREKFREKKRRGKRDLQSAGIVESPADLPPRVVRVAYFAAKPLTVADALVEFNLRRKDVLMFRPDADEDRWAVLFRRKDGSFGLVQPE